MSKSKTPVVMPSFDSTESSFKSIFTTFGTSSTSPHPSFGRGNASKSGQKYITCADGPPIPIREDGRRKRVHPTREQQELLETFFSTNPKPSANERARICQDVNINSRSVQIWFQNRRAKLKRIDADSSSYAPSEPPGSEEGDEGGEAFAASASHGTFGLQQQPSYLGSESLLITSPGTTRIFSTELVIGTWRRVATTPADLVTEVNLTESLLRWSVVEAGCTFKMEFAVASVVDVAIHPVPGNAVCSVITLDVGGEPLFFRKAQQGPFLQSGDFTEGAAASRVPARHVLQGASFEMEKLFWMLSEWFEAMKRGQIEEAGHLLQVNTSRTGASGGLLSPLHDTSRADQRQEAQSNMFPQGMNFASAFPDAFGVGPSFASTTSSGGLGISMNRASAVDNNPLEWSSLPSPLTPMQRAYPLPEIFEDPTSFLQRAMFQRKKL